MKIAIAGYGLEGEVNYQYYARDPAHQITIVDESETPSRPLPDGADTLLGDGAFSRLQDFDLVVRTAGLAPRKITTHGKIWSATNEFFARCPAPIIGVTGTKGKGTIASLTASILEAAGKNVWLVGNVGVAALGVLEHIGPDDVVVYELSSFQLWDIEYSPHVAIVGLIEPDHMNVHSSMEEYVAAKANIRRYQTTDDVCIYHATNPYSAAIASSVPEGTTLTYAASGGGGVFVEAGSFRVGEHTICSVSALQLRGEHNRENACAAITAALQFGVSTEAVERGLEGFSGLPHRLEFVRQVDGVDYYNDSFSSAPAATVAAVKAFSQPEIVVIGGIDKGGDFSELSRVFAHQSNTKQIVLIGTVRHQLAHVFGAAGLPTTVLDAQTMHEIVAYCRSIAQPGDVVILSPGCASFDMFKDFYDRGDQFRQEVLAL